MEKRETASPPLHSIVDIATASWYAHRASTPPFKQSTPPIKQSPSIWDEGLPRRASASESASESTSESDSASTAPLSHALPSGISASALLPLHTSSLGDYDGRASAEINVSSDITAWESALQCLPDEFENAEKPNHPLAQALVDQPTLRSVEWNQYRISGGFRPRTPHDYSSLMIYISGQVNPNPCRNCLLKNGPFARCVVSPLAVLADSTLRHACANCTYQAQYRRCTNGPISQSLKARSEANRGILKWKQIVPKTATARMPMLNGKRRHKLERERKERERRRTQDQAEKDQQTQGQMQKEQQTREQAQRREQLEESQENTSTAPSQLVMAGLDTSGLSFDEKLRHVRALSPRSRRKMTAEVLQWHAAIATIEVEEPMTGSMTASDMYNAHGAEHSYRFEPALSNTVPSNSTTTSSAVVSDPALANGVSVVGMGIAGHSARNTHDPMEEDESDGGDDGDIENTTSASPYLNGGLI
ncbi:hypothetical protein GGS21DRAFT_504874 [Xylaria nigripes]|nr:hypothetical protein GGS21DRAFT_504874 [Xylaria nigripes]